MHGDRGDVEILKRLGPDPTREGFDELFRIAASGPVIEFLGHKAMPVDVGAVVQQKVWRLSFRFSDWDPLEALRRLFRLGARWESSPPAVVAEVRRGLLSTSDHAFIEAVRLLAENDYCSPDVLKEIARTPSFRVRMKRVGFIPPVRGDSVEGTMLRPYGWRQVLVKFGIA